MVSAPSPAGGACDTRTIAYHEAGHAVACIVLGHPIKKLTIVETGESLGSCLSPSPIFLNYGDTKRDRRRAARECIVTIYAGPEAQRLLKTAAALCGCDGDEESAFEVSRDFGVLPRGCSFVGDDRHWALLERIRLEARQLVRSHWPTIEALAAALLVEGTLAGERIAEIVGRP